MRPCEWAATVNALAIAIAKDKSSDELQLLALLFTQLGDTLALLAFKPSEDKIAGTASPAAVKNTGPS